MKRCKILNLVLLISQGCVLFSLAGRFAFAQSVSADKSKLKTFGSSLKRFNSKNNKKNAGSAQETQPDEETIRVETNLVVNDILVVNSNGNAILGLTQKDFLITENETPQEISLFSFGESAALPRSIVLIIDRCVLQPKHLKNSIKAAKSLVDKLAPQDKMAIVTDGVKLLTDFTNDKSQLKKQLDSLNIDFNLSDLRSGKLASDGGRGDQFSSLLATLNELFTEENKRPVVIIQSGGGELLLLKPMQQEKLLEHYRERNFSFGDVINAVEKSRATIYPIILLPQLIGMSVSEQEEKLKPYFEGRMRQEQMDFHRGEYVADQTALIQIAKISGGYADFFENPEDAERIYLDVLKVINNRYTIGYYSTDQERNGQPRKIKIKVRGHPEFKILGRQSYTAPEL